MRNVAFQVISLWHAQTDINIRSFIRDANGKTLQSRGSLLKALDPQLRELLVGQGPSLLTMTAVLLAKPPNLQPSPLNWPDQLEEWPLVVPSRLVQVSHPPLSHSRRFHEFLEFHLDQPMDLQQPLPQPPLPLPVPHPAKHPHHHLIAQ